MIDDNWEVIEKTASNGIKTAREMPSGNQTTSASVDHPVNPEVRKLTRRRSDSSLLSLRKSSSIFLDTSALDPTQRYDREVKKLKVSCNKCGKAKSKIKSEILKLSEQLMSSNKSEAEVNAKIKEFLDYLESKSQPSEMTETEASSIEENVEGAQCASIPTSNSHEDIGANIFDENEGINVYPSASHSSYQPLTTQDAGATRRFISLDDIHSE
jgi:seryl-tRNA synthetase